MVYLKTDKKEFIMSNIREEAIILFREIRLSFWKSEITEQQYIEKTRDMLLSFLPKPELAQDAAKKIVALNLKYLPTIEDPENATAQQRSSAFYGKEQKRIKVLCAYQTAELDRFMEG